MVHTPPQFSAVLHKCTNLGIKLLISTLPAGEQIGRQFDIKLVDHPIDGLIDDVFHAFGWW